MIIVAIKLRVIQSLVATCQAELLQAWLVSRRVSKTTDDDPGLIEPEGDKITHPLFPD